MIRRMLAAAALVMLLPGSGLAGASVYGPAQYTMGPSGGDGANTIQADPATGQMTVIRHQVTPGSFGCGGNGGYAYFAVSHPTAGVTSATVHYDDALIDPYAFLKISIRQGDAFLGTALARGLIVRSGKLTVALDAPSTGPVEVWFGIEVGSACPNVDVGTARFPSVTVRT